MNSEYHRSPLADNADQLGAGACRAGLRCLAALHVG